MNFYNEHDPKAAAWLRELIRAGVIPNGVVDERDIRAIDAAELRQFRQCHFFAGIGGWSLALRLAGWPDDQPVWTGSCPCQPFSSAGKQMGRADSRHLWPAFRRLINRGAPAVVFGEQVASAAGRDWLAGVRANLETMGYAVGAADLCAAGVGAPHIRQRLYWVGHSQSERWNPVRNCDHASKWSQISAGIGGAFGGVADSANGGRSEHVREPRPGATEAEEHTAKRGAVGGVVLSDSGGPQPGRQTTEAMGHGHSIVSTGGAGGLEHPEEHGREQRGPESGGGSIAGGCGIGRVADVQQPGLEGHAGNGDGGEKSRRIGAAAAGPTAQGGGLGDGMGHTESSGDRAASVVGVDCQTTGERRECFTGGSGAFGFWSAFDLILCLDGKARRIEPGSFPLAHGVSGRVGLLRGYGNAIVPQVAAEFVSAFLEARGDLNP